ncbi:MAG: response regulator [Actinomycetia bacterium]|nr:response regulator [Actinomycetes bacterium]MCP4224890.1 response regulator [Actinomycetes bacterium]MCP5035328.1 response regulator [Actinomycetes bacterium]
MSEQHQPKAQPVSANMRAVVIDDSRAARTMVGNMLAQLGFEICAAEHGQDALDKLQDSEPPAAVVVDWNMPVMDGVEFARAFRQIDEFKTTPLLMISSEADPRRVATALMAGIDEYLFKPVDSEMIRERLEIMGLHLEQAS